MSTPRIHLDEEHVDLAKLPRFQRAAFYARYLRRLSLGLASLALLMLATTHWLSSNLLRIALIDSGAGLLLLAAGLQSAYWVARWRIQVAGEIPTSAAENESDNNAELNPSFVARVRSRFYKWIGVSNEWLGGHSGQALWLGILSLIIVLFVVRAWNLTSSAMLSAAAMQLAGGMMLVAGFGLLVLERHVAGRAPLEWPEQAQMTQLARVALATLLLSAACLLLSNDERMWPMRVLLVVGALPLAVATELLLRAMLSPFNPHDERIEPTLLADSIVAGLLRWPLRPLQTLQHELQQRFGIDLRQNWAFAYVRRASLPVMALVALCGWLLTGVREIPIDGRGIYERFGRPTAVWQPGLHAGLPWPFGKMRAIENGVVHELTATSTADLQSETPTSTKLNAASDVELNAAEGPAPDSANRLWDVSHTAEKSQVIASLAGDRQSFHIVNMDVRFIYRIGLGNQAALAATYNSIDIEALIRSTAGQILVRKFAARTLDSLLGEQRTELGNEIAGEVQAQLDALHSGVQLLATIVEAIHPPAGAANAYHSVQAAQIRAQSLIARERGSAAEQLNLAQLKSSIARDKATASAREIQANAQAANLRYVAERDAYRTAGKAFLLEHYLSQLSQGLNGSTLVIVDHRIGGGGASPTIDLRTYTTPIDTNIARRSEP